MALFSLFSFELNGTFQACELCTARLAGILFLLTNLLTLQKLQTMPKHDRKRKQLEDDATTPLTLREARDLTSSDEDCTGLTPIITDQDIDALEIHVQEDSLEEMEINFEQVRKKQSPEDDTIEQLVGETGRLELKDDTDREKYGWEKLMKATTP